MAQTSGTIEMLTIPHIFASTSKFMRHKEHQNTSENADFGHPLWTVGYWIGQPQELPLEVRGRYSEMKYGSVEAQAWWVEMLSAQILSDARLTALRERFGRIYLASSAYGAVPTAAANLTDALAAKLSEAGWSVELFKIERQGGFERTNYGTLGASARRRVMRARRLGLSKEITVTLTGKFVLVIDDIRCTGAHEREIIALFANETKLGALAFAYCIGFEGNTQSNGEEDLNHAKVTQPTDLLPWFADAATHPRINARMLKFILLQNPQQLNDFLSHAGVAAATQLYAAALSADGYFDKPRFKLGFSVLEEWLIGAGAIAERRSFQTRNLLEGKVVVWNVATSERAGFFCAESMRDLSTEVSLYSRFKFGDVDAIRKLSRILADRFVSALEAGGSLRDTFERASHEGEFVSLTAPGIRNVVSASNALMREVGMLVNVWLTTHALPTMIIRSLPRLSSGRANYAELNATERQSREKTTQTLVPEREYQLFPSHVIFIDDIEVTGQTANRAREASLGAGALSFHSAFLFRVDPDLAKQQAGVEHQMNHFFVSRKLDANIGFLLKNGDYQPVQRMLRLLLHPENRDDLLSFLDEYVSDEVLIRVYLASMANDYMWIHAPDRGVTGEYGPSLVLMRTYMADRGLLDERGWPK